MKLSDEEILQGWRKGDSTITRDYFYPYCRVAWFLNDRHYGLATKGGMDFYSLSHEYYIKLAQRQWEPLEHRNDGVSLRTYMINGFHFLVLDELKVYGHQQQLESFEERVANRRLRFDLAEDTSERDYRAAIDDICGHLRNPKDVVVLRMRLLDGYKGKEISKQLSITPAAVSQRFHRLWNHVVLPYFKGEYPFGHLLGCPSPEPGIREYGSMKEIPGVRVTDEKITGNVMIVAEQRICPNRITELEPHEIFVFGSNLAGIHGGGAARQALMRFGAVMGQGVGPQGRCYAIPTMQGGVETIRPYVDDFIAYARQHHDLRFLVTQIGCGIAGFSPTDIAPLFRDGIGQENISLPRSFWQLLV